MATALQLTAANSIINGQGLAASANLLTQITTFHSQEPLQYISNIFANVSSANANVTSNITTVLANLGQGVTNGSQWLIDFYPPNVTPVSSGDIYYYEYEATPQWGGNVYFPIITGYTYAPAVSTASFSRTLANQANLPFTYGIPEFANVYATATGYASSVFDTVSSVYLLRGKTYSQTGIGYTGPIDLATNGINNKGQLLNQAVANWGTMYDVSNINKLGDPYVFGQNLLNQGLGQFGNWDTQLTNVGLNTQNLSAIPTNVSITTITESSVTVSSLVGDVEIYLPEEVTTSTVVTGNSPDVVVSIYANVVGANLQAITTAAQFSSNSASTLADYLTLSKVVDPLVYKQLTNLGITTLSDLGSMLQNIVGQGYYKSWADLGNFLLSIDVPTLYNTTANANTLALDESIASDLLEKYGTGSGPFNNPVLTDYLGAVAGMPYTSLMNTINTNYTAATPGNLVPALKDLDSAVATYISAASAFELSNIAPIPDVGPVTTAVAEVNSSLSSAKTTAASMAARSAYYSILNQLTSEVANCNKAGVTFNNPRISRLDNFAMGIGDAASGDNYNFFANLITNDHAGDTVRLRVAEVYNSRKLSNKGITTTNDPNPASILSQSLQQNVPVSTIIARNFGGNTAISGQ